MEIRRIVKIIFGLIVLSLVLCIVAPPLYDYYKSPVRRVNSLLKKAQSIARSEHAFVGIHFRNGDALLFKSEYRQGPFEYFDNRIPIDPNIEDTLIIYSPLGPPVALDITLNKEKFRTRYDITIDGKMYHIDPYSYGFLETKK